jgi:hypothetical protein
MDARWGDCGEAAAVACDAAFDAAADLACDVSWPLVSACATPSSDAWTTVDEPLTFVGTSGPGRRRVERPCRCGAALAATR